jgi:hypothetical protein
MKAPLSASALRLVTLLSFLLTPYFLACGQQTNTSGNDSTHNPQFASISGQVLRSGTDQPLKKARVLLMSENDNSADPYIAITDSEGRFSIAGIRPGRYKMNVERDGFISKSYGEDKTGSSSAVLLLKSGQRITDLLFRLQKCGVISGRVLDEDGEPARNVGVVAAIRSTRRGKTSTESARWVTTNDIGEYRLFDLEPGSYFVSASLKTEFGTTIGKIMVDSSIVNSVGGYIPTYYPSASEISRASPVEVKAGDEIPGVDIILLRQRSYRVQGQVINSVIDHPPPSDRGDIVIMFQEDEDSQSLASMRRSRADRKTGEFQFLDVRPGRYKFASSYRDGDHEYVGITPAEVINADLMFVRVVISRGADLRGRVIKEGKNMPSSVTRISAVSRDTGAIGGTSAAETKSDGSFVLVGLPDGLYDISALSSDCDTCFVKSVTAGGTDVFDSGLTISSGFAPSPIELVVSSRAGSIDGTVKNDDGSPVSGATVVLAMDHAHRGQDDLHTSTDQFGYFIVRGVAPGTYHAFAWKNVDYRDYEDPDFRQPFLPKAQAFSVSEDEKKTLQLTLLPASADSQ